MCQLLGMNCNVPTDMVFSFEGLRARSGVTDHHSDGWGVGFFEGAGCRLFLDTKAAVDSPVADLLRRYPIRTLNGIAHIRKATIGEVVLENTHPFLREIWGQYWLFAHNGDLKDFTTDGLHRFQPVGGTDSERAFCLMLERLHLRFPDGRPGLAELIKAIRQITADVAGHGTFNYLLSNGEWMMAHCATALHYIVRKAPFGPAHLIDQDVSIDFYEVTTPDDIVAVVATQPLTDNEIWIPITSGETVLFQHGQAISL
ncbi:MAG: class II glutamine amidotransferase [Mariprofundaceae bacterium]